MLGKLKLRKLMWLGYSLPITLILIITALIGSVSIKISEVSVKTDRAESAIVYSNQMAIALLMMVRDFRGYLLFKRDDLLNTFDGNWQSFQSAAISANEVVDNPAQKKRLEKMIQLIKLIC